MPAHAIARQTDMAAMPEDGSHWAWHVIALAVVMRQSMKHVHSGCSEHSSISAQHDSRAHWRQGSSSSSIAHAPPVEPEDEPESIDMVPAAPEDDELPSIAPIVLDWPPLAPLVLEASGGSELVVSMASTPVEVDVPSVVDAISSLPS
jgi:hypothetical protein